MARHHGLISFSDNSRDPVLWAHYAELHTGITPEFDPRAIHNLIRVKYADDRVRLQFGSGATVHAEYRDALASLMRTKYRSWAYEKEYRAQVPLRDCAPHRGHYFRRLSDFSLKGVLLGMNCSVSPS